jgi:hypothetical protein
VHEEREEAACFQYWQLGAAFFLILLERFFSRGGRMALAGCLSPGGFLAIRFH